MPFVSLLVLAFALSLDSFGVGVTYGLRKITIPPVSLAIIALMSGLVIFVSMQIGVWLSSYFSVTFAKVAGAVILIGIGIWAIAQVFVRKREEDAPAKELPVEAAEGAGGEKAIVRIEIKTLGLVIQILRTPAAADVDRSGIISASEAMLLGLALSLDAFGAGIGAAFIGFTPTVTAIVIAIASYLFIAAGLRVGFVYADLSWVRRLSVIPGCMLIVIGILRMM